MKWEIENAGSSTFSASKNDSSTMYHHKYQYKFWPFKKSSAVVCTVNAAESFELKKLNNALGFRFRSLVIKEEIPSWEKRFFPQNTK